MVGHRLIEIKSGVSALRSVQTGLMQLAYATAQRPKSKAFLVLPDVAVTRERLQEEWGLAASVLRPDLVDRLSLCVVDRDQLIGIPRDPDAETRRILFRVIKEESHRLVSNSVRGDASFVVLEICIRHWLPSPEVSPQSGLARTCGYSYPTVASALHGLGSLVERQSDRRLRLRWASREEFARLRATSDRAGEQPASPIDPAVRAHSDLTCARLEKLDLPGPRLRRRSRRKALLSS